MEASKQKNKGLQKIEIKRVERKSARQVTFSKRKKGLFNKASELCVLCGAEVAIVIMSPHKRAFTFGHPNPDDVLDRFLTGAGAESSLAATTVEDDEKLERLKQEYVELLNRLKEEEKKRDEIAKKRGNDRANGVFWWDQYSIDDMERDELELYLKSLEKLKTSVKSKVDELAAASQASNNFVNQFNIDNNVPIDFGSEFDDLCCLLEGTNEDGILRNLDL